MHTHFFIILLFIYLFGLGWPQPSPIHIFGAGPSSAHMGGAGPSRTSLVTGASQWPGNFRLQACVNCSRTLCHSHPLIKTLKHNFNEMFCRVRDTCLGAEWRRWRAALDGRRCLLFSFCLLSSLFSFFLWDCVCEEQLLVSAFEFPCSGRRLW